MLFRKWATKWAVQLARNAGETDSYKRDLARYIFEALLSGVLSLLFIVVLTLIFGVLKTALVITAAAAILKSFTGGLHMSTPLRCAIAGAFAAVILSYLAVYYPLSDYFVPIKVFLLLTVNIIVWLKAPLESKGKPLGTGQKNNLAWASRILVFLVSIACLKYPGAWGVNETFYALVFQGINLLKTTGWGLSKLDRLLGYVEKSPVF